MNALYPFFVTFILIFVAELGDKTQLLVLSFASKSKTRNILLGVAIGTFLSHGIAIIFGSNIGAFQNQFVLFVLKILTYITFLFLGFVGFIPKKENSNEHKNGIITHLSNFSLNYVLIVAVSIMLGEIGDKTFLASIGLGLEYPNFKFALIAGAILGMIVSNSVAILFGKFISNRISDKFIHIVSNLIFIVFGVIGILMMFLN